MAKGSRHSETDWMFPQEPQEPDSAAELDDGRQLKRGRARHRTRKKKARRASERRIPSKQRRPDLRAGQVDPATTWAKRITVAWGKTVAAVVEVGHQLLAAKAALP